MVITPCWKDLAIVVKEEFEVKAKELFNDTGIQITSQGRPYLGAPLGCSSFCEEFVKQKVEEWKKAIITLTEIARSQPHAAYLAFSRGLSRLWCFLCRITPEICHLLKPLDDVIFLQFLPVLLGRQIPGAPLRSLLTHPTRFGGLNMVLPSSSSLEMSLSIKLTAPIVRN